MIRYQLRFITFIGLIAKFAVARGINISERHPGNEALGDITTNSTEKAQGINGKDEQDKNCMDTILWWSLYMLHFEYASILCILARCKIEGFERFFPIDYGTAITEVRTRTVNFFYKIEIILIIIISYAVWLVALIVPFFIDDWVVLGAMDGFVFLLIFTIQWFRSCVRNESSKSNRQDAEVAMERNSTTRQNATSMRNSSIINDSNQRPRSDPSECTYPNDSPIDPSLDSSTNQSAESSTSKTGSDQSQNETDLLIESKNSAKNVSFRPSDVQPEREMQMTSLIEPFYIAQPPTPPMRLSQNLNVQGEQMIEPPGVPIRTTSLIGPAPLGPIIVSPPPSRKLSKNSNGQNQQVIYPAENLWKSGTPYIYANRVKAIHDYCPVKEDEMELVKGDIIYEIGKRFNDDGWAQGYKQGDTKSSMFPANYVIPLRGSLDTSLCGLRVSKNMIDWSYEQEYD